MTSVVKQLFRTFGIDISRAEPRRNDYVTRPAWDYQSPYILPLLRSTDVVIDVGCGAAPSPVSQIRTDFFPDFSIHRARAVIEDRPLVICAADRMPFRDNAFDFSICSHVLEHVPDPVAAGREIARISPAGYIETPTYGKDILIGTGDQHIWQVVLSAGEFHFFPYTQRQKSAHSTSPVMSIWCQSEYHDWQPFFWDRQDVFNSILTWRDTPTINRHGPPQFGKPDRIWSPVPERLLPEAPATLKPAEISMLEDCLLSPDGKQAMLWKVDRFVSADGSAAYPVRAKRIYFEHGDASQVP